MHSIQATDLYAAVSLQRLQVFVAVSDHGGFSAAADFLDLGQPTVSFHVRALERTLGAKLLVYRQRRVQLTAAGAELYPVAVGILRDVESVAATIRDVSTGQAGHLRLGASMAFELGAFFERVVGPFQRGHPGVRLSIQFGHSVYLAEAVHDNRLDMAYVTNWRLPAGARYQRLHAADFLLMVAPDHVLARKKHVTPDEVDAAGLITAPLHSQEWPHYDRLLRASGLVGYRVGLEIDGVQARILATRAGLGVMAVFVLPYAAESIGATLRPLSMDQLAPRVEFGLVTPRASVSSVLAEQFASWLVSVSHTP
jgi:DNA-binding transcriptional LysR family regulator